MKRIGSVTRILVMFYSAETHTFARDLFFPILSFYIPPSPSQICAIVSLAAFISKSFKKVNMVHHTGCFFTGPPPKSSKYRKADLGKVWCI